MRPAPDRRCRAGEVWLLGVRVGGDFDLGGICVSGNLVLQNAGTGQNLFVRVAAGVSPRGCGDRVRHGHARPWVGGLRRRAHLARRERAGPDRLTSAGGANTAAGSVDFETLEMVGDVRLHALTALGDVSREHQLRDLRAIEAQPPVELDIGPSAAATETHVAPPRWSSVDAVMFTTQLHVPIISLGVDTDGRPRGTIWRIYAMIVVALHWIMWPLLIASMSGFVRKRT